MTNSHMQIPFIFRMFDVIFMTFVMLLIIGTFFVILFFYVLKKEKKDDERV